MKFIAGPMATLSHQAFRKCIEKFGGCDEYFTEMINASSFLTNGPFEKYYILNDFVPQKIVWQITCNKTEPIIKTAEILCQKGGLGIDLNMGCSAPQIAKTGAGIAWMKKSPQQIKELICGVKEVLNNYEAKTKNHIRLSVKCRLGGEGFSENSLLNFCDLLFTNGVELLTLHPRTQKEKDRILPRYEYVKLLKNNFPDKKIYLNGNIKDKSSLDFALNKAPHTDGIMISRAIAQKPWLFSILNKENSNGIKEIDLQQLAIDFINDVKIYQPQQYWKTRLQRFFTYFCMNFQFAHYFQTQMLNSNSPEESCKKVIDYFDKQKEERFLILP